MTAVAIVDHERATRERVARIIQSCNHLCLAGAFGNVERALNGLHSTSVEIALVEVELPDLSGAKPVHELKCAFPNIKIIVYARREESSTILQCLKAGALGYLTKDIFPTRLLQAIQDVVAGGSCMVPSVARKVIDSFHVDEDPIVWPTFSEREQEVLALLCKGHSYREIAEQLFVSPNTVRFHLKNIYRKMKVNSRHEAVVKASRVGMVKAE